MNGRRIGVVMFLLGGFLGLTSCASIVSKSNYPIDITSNPPDADVLVFNSKGEEIHRGVTPMQITLPSKKGYFSGEEYNVTVSKNGFQTQSFTIGTKLNGWYAGNLVFGGLLGFLVIDPLTGAMWRLSPDKLDAQLERTPSSHTHLDGESSSLPRESLSTVAHVSGDG